MSSDEASVLSDIPDANELNGVVAELAALSPIDYDLRRKDVAKTFGIRVDTLDDEVARFRQARPGDGQSALPPVSSPSPWPEAVDGKNLLNQIAETIRQYVVLPPHIADAIALWVIHAHAHDAFSVSPLIIISSPEKRCGKTSLLNLIARMSPRPIQSSNITPAALFRIIEQRRPTLLIDEADTFLRDNVELRGVINSGHVRQSAFVIRTTGEEHEPIEFSTWAPKAIAAIGKLPDTLSDRSIIVPLRRKLGAEKVKRLRADRTDQIPPFDRLAARWVVDHFTQLAEADPSVPTALNDRAADNWRPLFAIADLAGGDWPERARNASLLLAANDTDESISAMLLADIRQIFTRRGGDRIASRALLAELAAMEERPWPEFRNGKPISPRQIASLLGRYSVIPQTIRTGPGTEKGYYRQDFEEAFLRYLPTEP